MLGRNKYSVYDAISNNRNYFFLYHILILLYIHVQYYIYNRKKHAALKTTNVTKKLVRLMTKLRLVIPPKRYQI